MLRTILVYIIVCNRKDTSFKIENDLQNYLHSNRALQSKWDVDETDKNYRKVNMRL